MRCCLAAIAASLLVSFAPVCRAETIGYMTVTSGHSGAQTQVDVNHFSDWVFTTSAARWYFGGGLLDMKEGSGSDAPITLLLYEGGSTLGRLLGGLTYTNTEFDTAHGGNAQKWSVTPFLFSASGYLLEAHTTYYVTLTSTAPDRQSEAYFIKGVDSAAMTDIDGNVIPGLITDDGITHGSTPEPGSLVLFGGGAGLLGVVLWRRRR